MERERERLCEKGKGKIMREKKTEIEKGDRE